MNENQEITGSHVAKQQGIRRVTRQFGAFIGGFLLCFGPFMAMLALQSSINIKGGVGTTAMGIAYTASVAMTIFVSPVAVRRIGSKWVMIFGEISYLVYIGANLYPKPWAMVAAGILVGIGEALMWTALPMYLWHFGHLHGLLGSKGFESYVRKYTGMFYAAFQCAQIFGSSLSFGILYGIKSENDSGMRGSESFNQSSILTGIFQYCGAHDCQDQNVTSRQITKYIPENSVSLYILIGLFCLLCVTGIIFHVYYLPPAATKHKRLITDDNNPLKERTNFQSEQDPTVVSHDGKSKVSYGSTLGATFKHAVKWKQLLLVPLLLYIGLENTIILAEASRSFISCIFGVERIGVVIVPFAIFNAAVSLLVPKAIEKFGRNTVMVFAMVIDIANYAFCLLWLPEERNKYLVFLIFFEFAISEPTWKNCTLDIYTHFFPRDQEISYAVWNVWITFGLAVGFLWSPLFCVYTKLYIQIGMVLASMLFYSVAYNMDRRLKSISGNKSTS